MPDGRVGPRQGNIGPQVDPAETTRVVPFNDIAALERALADRDVAAVLVEPALTNIGIVLPEPGYLEAMRELTRATDTILINDETHTICAGPGGATGAWGLDPDMLVIGKTIGGGIPVGDVRLHRGDRRPDQRERSPSRTPTSAGSAGRSPATPSRWPRSGRP